MRRCQQPRAADRRVGRMWHWILASAFGGLAPQSPPSPVAWKIELEQVDPPRVAIEVEFEGDSDGQSALILEVDWAGTKGAGEDLTQASARSVSGKELALQRPSPGRLEIQHAPLERVVARYVLVPTKRQPGLGQSEYYLPVLRPGLLHAMGKTLLFRPEHLDASTPRSLSFAFAGFEEQGQKPACSYGLGCGPMRVVRDLESGLHALFLAGNARARLVALDVPGGQLAVWIEGSNWPFQDQELASLAQRVVLCGREFFADHKWPFYLISLLETGAPGERASSLGGTGLTQSFAMFLSAGMSLAGPGGGAMSVAGLLMHEHFHNWNGMLLRMAQPEQRLYWISEGFTNFFTRRLLLRCGFTSPTEYAADLSRTWSAYRSNPMRNVSAERIEQDFWNLREVGEVPYQRGDLLAAWLDGKLRAHSGGERGLDDFFRELVERARRGPNEITLESFLELTEAWAGKEEAGVVERVAVEGADVPVDLDLYEPCLRGEWTKTFAFELGFDAAATQRDKVVRNVVAGSQAERAGLREGAQLAGLKYSLGQAESEVEVMLRGPSGVQTLRYFPRGAATEVVRFVVDAGAPESACSKL